MIILDTDTMTHFSYGKGNVRKKVESVGEDEQLAVTLITWHELLRGRADSLLKAADEEELRKAMERFRQTEAMLADFLVLPVDHGAVQQPDVNRPSVSWRIRPSAVNHGEAVVSAERTDATTAAKVGPAA